MDQSEFAKKYYTDTVPLFDQLEKISELDIGDLMNVANVYVEDASYSEAEHMLWVYQAYKRSDKFHPLFFLCVMNRLRIYTPYYCEHVISWAKKYRIENEAAGGAWVGANIAQVLANSPVEVEMCTKWVLNFFENLFARKSNVLSALEPKVSRAENNISKYAFKNKIEFEAYFQSRGREFSTYFFYYYYNFSHLYENKIQYLDALKRLSGIDWYWYGCPQWPDE